MSGEYHVPEWDCTGDIIDVTETIGKFASVMLLQEFVSKPSTASKSDIQNILRDFAQRNVTAALELAAKGLAERLQIGRDFDNDFGPPDGRIDIMEAIRIVRELDYTDDGD
jgi:hypothetical protein